MREAFYFDSCGKGKIHACLWLPEGKPKAVVQLVHGIAEHVLRYEEFAKFLTTHGYAVAAEDHMGHGGSVSEDVKGYFHGGWFAAIDDTLKLLTMMKERFGPVPYVLFGHSMGSFMVRTILTDHPDLEIAGCVICGTGWQPKALMDAGLPACKAVCKIAGENKPNKFLYGMIFGGYNKRVERVRTPSDWLSRDSKIVDAYEADPLCGFVPAAGLLRDMMLGIVHIQKQENLANMNKQLPCLIISGGDDPVGDYGKGVYQTADAFKNAGMNCVKTKVYPLCRHEILNEINRKEVFDDVLNWLEGLESLN